ncbi:TenA family transcriptional regulator [Calidifontibacter sp. DB0510]|uniref:Aminopyrimidine aminohydrolase n=1 Tax=Metallococcus carri TaxID=1656884 RepID=A0A967B4X7_9MICO|nr:TenA family protein [Metallococcus carri]NHN57340.1 TenA family transcriptional regulator [Metallococcus carri]NOP39118.1 TenA family protein [Calidifontibacter sp. DB2511S]
MTRSANLKAANDENWRAAIRHRFVNELLDGTLDDKVLAAYLVQDYQFFDAFVALLGQACASAPTLAARMRYAAQLGMLASDEDTYFTDTFDALGVPDQDRTHPELRTPTREFEAIMREATASRSYTQVLAVLVVAEWLYLDWGSRADDGMTATRPEHVRWIDLHRGPEFAAWVEFLRAEFDAARGTDDAAAEALFARAVAAEVAFFDAAYT